MKFYDCAGAPSPRRVRIFLAEKGITLPTVQVDLRKGEQFTDSFRALNPDCTVPVLELDDGTCITDAIGICVYLEAVRPDPPLMGRDPKSRAVIAAAQRRAEREGFYAVVEAFRDFTPGLKGHALPGPDSCEQIPALASAAAPGCCVSSRAWRAGSLGAILSAGRITASPTSPLW